MAIGAAIAGSAGYWASRTTGFIERFKIVVTSERRRALLLATVEAT